MHINLIPWCAAVAVWSLMSMVAVLLVNACMLALAELGCSVGNAACFSLSHDRSSSR